MSNNVSPQRTELLNLVSQIKSRVADKLGASVAFPIPQFILIGKQSVGKSRLVESFAGETFNFVSGTLGSRRPTVLEFRNNLKLDVAQWQVLDASSHRWKTQPIEEVMRIVGEAHQSLGCSVSSDPVYVRVESPYCVDMQIVDLPGFRDFALDKDKQELADQIEKLVFQFMSDPRNVMLCVEEAGDAANMATLAKCKRLDPEHRRTILIRNKLDKYYKDLSSDNVNEWLRGYGDLPEHLDKYSLSLPHWKDSGSPPPRPFRELLVEASEGNVEELRLKGAKDTSKVGFGNFASFMENKIESVFHAAIGPSMIKLKELQNEWSQKFQQAKTEFNDTDSSQITHTIRSAGQSFSHGLNHVMNGLVPSRTNRLTLDEELRMFSQFVDFNDYHDEFDLLPTMDFRNLDDYLSYLRDEARIPEFDLPLNGGAQYTRLKHECEVYFRFSEICVEVSKRDVLQARGISVGQVSWQDVVLKLLVNEGQPQVRRKIKYVGKRIEWFFSLQKEIVVEFMDTIRGSPDEHLYSQLFTRRVQLIKENDLARSLMFAKFDAFLSKQNGLFIDLFNNTIQSTFQYPWALIKASSWTYNELDSFVKKEDATDDDEEEELQHDFLEDMDSLPCFADTKARIPKEISQRSTVEKLLQQMVNEIPMDNDHVDDAVEKVQALMITVFRAIRNLICDQLELFADSFFQLPMSRHLENEMMNVSLSEAELARFEATRATKERIVLESREMLDHINWCVSQVEQFTTKRLI